MKVIPQFGFLYRASLKDNLDPSGQYSRQELSRILVSTGLRIRATEEEPIDLDLKVEDGGKNLSNGEKQIINYWRIILEEQEIVCLDEATSNMDPKTDQLIHQNLFSFC